MTRRPYGSAGPSLTSRTAVVEWLPAFAMVKTKVKICFQFSPNLYIKAKNSIADFVRKWLHCTLNSSGANSCRLRRQVCHSWAVFGDS